MVVSNTHLKYKAETEGQYEILIKQMEQYYFL